MLVLSRITARHASPIVSRASKVWREPTDFGGKFGGRFWAFGVMFGGSLAEFGGKFEKSNRIHLKNPGKRQNRQINRLKIALSSANHMAATNSKQLRDRTGLSVSVPALKRFYKICQGQLPPEPGHWGLQCDKRMKLTLNFAVQLHLHQLSCWTVQLHASIKSA